VNDSRIKTCINRYDSGAHTPMQFLDAMSHNRAPTPQRGMSIFGDDDDDVTDEDAAQTMDQTPPQDAAVTSEPAARACDDCCDCEVCLISRKDPRMAPMDISVSASRARRRYVSVGTDVHCAGLTLP